jgi:hypothetical protein
MNIWHYFFSWYDGSVWPNIVASGITGSLAYWRLRKHQKKHHAASMTKLEAIHNDVVAGNDLQI